MSGRYAVFYLEFAQRDVDDIVAESARRGLAEASAWVDSLDKAGRRLAAHPESGSIPEDDILALKGYRAVRIDDYLAFYLIKGRAVEIHRVLPGAQRYEFLRLVILHELP